VQLAVATTKGFSSRSGLSQLLQQEQRRLRLLAQGQPQRVLLAPVTYVSVRAISTHSRLAIPENEGAIGGVLFACFSETEYLEVSYTANCKKSDVENID
jgi:hypothetical protein